MERGWSFFKEAEYKIPVSIHSFGKWVLGTCLISKRWLRSLSEMWSSLINLSLLGCYFTSLCTLNNIDSLVSRDSQACMFVGSWQVEDMTEFPLKETPTRSEQNLNPILSSGFL